MKTNRILSIALIAIIGFLSLSITACGANNNGHNYPMAAMDDMPEEVRMASTTTQQAYQFAAANPDVMRQLPCYCGCGPIGHTSNYDCYVAEQGADGKPVIFDNHALGCSICVDITQDAMRLLDEGKTTPEIRAYIDQTYAKYGPSNIP